MKKIGLVMVLVLMVMTLVGSVVMAEEMSKLDQIKEKGKLVLGTAADYPPYEFHKQIDGKDTIVGFDIDIAKEIAKEIGVELEIKDMKFDGLLAALKTGNIDLIIAGMVPTEERKKSVDFSTQYYQAEQKFLAKADQAEELVTIEDLAGLKIGAQKATVQEKIAKTKVDAGEVKALSKITDLVMELKYNKIDGIILVKPVATAYASANDDLAVAPVSLGKEDGIAVAVEQNTPELLASINQTLEKLMAEDKVNEFIQAATELTESN